MKFKYIQKVSANNKDLTSYHEYSSRRSNPNVTFVKSTWRKYYVRRRRFWDKITKSDNSTCKADDPLMSIFII